MNESYELKMFSNMKKSFIVIQTAVYTAERLVLHWNFSEPKNPRFIIESGFKSRASNNGARTVIHLLRNSVILEPGKYSGIHKLVKLDFVITKSEDVPPGLHVVD